MAIWDDVISREEMAIYNAAGYGVRGGFGHRPAVLVTDVNYGFTGDKPEPILESIKKWRNSCGEQGWKGVYAIKELLKVARTKGIPIFYSTPLDRLPETAGRWSDKNSRAITQQGVEGFKANDIVADIAPGPGEIVIHKEKPSVFFGTPLLGYLIDRGVDSLIVAGSTTSGCVRATVVDAFSYNFKVTVVEECCFDRGEMPHKINLFDMNAKYADVVSLAEVEGYILNLS